MSKILEKALKDSIKENKVTMGSKQVLSSVKNSKLVVLSKSVNDEISKQIQENAKKDKVPFVNFQGTSVALGKLCGLQYRISSLSFTSLSDTNVKSIIKDTDTGESNE